MSTTAEFIASIRERLAAIEKERHALLQIIAMHEGDAAPAAVAERTLPKVPAKTPAKAPASVPQRRGKGNFPNPFTKTPGGPTERILEVLNENPGLRYGELVDLAFERGVVTASSNPKKSLGNTISMLISRDVIERDSAGRHFLK